MGQKSSSVKNAAPGHIRDLTEFQSILQSYAYPIIGDQMAAEDVVQEVVNQYVMRSKDDNTIHHHRNYLIRSVINRSISEKKKLVARRDSYPGSWLPTPVLTEEDVYHSIDRQWQVSYSLLVMMEKLTVVERAVFLLKDTYGYAHAEVAEILDITTDYSRQALRRARLKLSEVGEPEVGHHESSEFLDKLTHAILDSDMDKLTHLLHTEVKAVSDGGPHQPAARKTIYGDVSVAKLMRAIHGKYLLPGTTIRKVLINHQPAFLYQVEDKVYRCVVVETAETSVRSFYIMVNQDKLKAVQELK